MTLYEDIMIEIRRLFHIRCSEDGVFWISRIDSWLHSS